MANGAVKANGGEGSLPVAGPDGAAPGGVRFVQEAQPLVAISISFRKPVLKHLGQHYPNPVGNSGAALGANGAIFEVVSDISVQLRYVSLGPDQDGDAGTQEYGNYDDNGDQCDELASGHV
jgi:hypothetical protein